MAAASLLALLDDIASVLDDVATMTKVAAGKTAGVLGDDLAINAEQVAGVRAERELPVVWAVARGSFINKLILVPAALLIAATLPWLVAVLLVIGGAWLCYEGSEKLWHSLRHHGNNDDARLPQPAISGSVDLPAFEQERIRGAVRTDFVLSAEIIVIALGIVKDAPFFVQLMAISAIAVLMTVGVYGIVAAIVKLDDLGVYLLQKKATPLSQKCGRLILLCAPYLMRLLSVVGTVAMFMVGGSILLHGIPHADVLTAWPAVTDSLPAGALISALLSALVNLFAGLIVGSLLLLLSSLLPLSGRQN